MRIEYQLTAEEFINAQINHAANSPRPRGKAGVIEILLYAAGWGGYAWLAYRSFPWFDPTRRFDALMACVIVPMLPWMLVALRTAFVVCRNRPLRAPWKAGNRMASRGASFLKSAIPFVPSVFGLACDLTVIAIKFESFRHPDQFPVIDPALIVICILPLPLWIFSLCVLIITRVSRRPNAWRAWEQQTHLHAPTTVDIDVDRVVVATEQYRAEYKWSAYVGSLETPSQFLLYISPASFHILPKRAFGSAENRDAMHHLLEAQLAKPTAAFPVHNVISKPANVLER